LSNLTSDPQLSKTGARPFPYYAPMAKSPLINAGLPLGLNLGIDFTDGAPDIGAYEYNGTAVPAAPSALQPAQATPSSGTTVLTLDSSDALLTGVMTTGKDVGAYNGSYFYVAPGKGKNYYVPSPASAAFNFQLSKGGSYVVWAKVKSPTASNQNYLIYNGSGKWFNWSAGVHTNWTWVKITDANVPALFTFAQGQNKFEMAWADDNVQIDQVVITDNMSYTPI